MPAVLLVARKCGLSSSVVLRQTREPAIDVFDYDVPTEKTLFKNNTPTREREREQVRKAPRRTSIKISLMTYDSPHVIHSLKTCSPFVVSDVNALDIRNISLSYHVGFFVCRVSRNFSWIQARREAWNSGRYRSRNSIRSCTSASFIFGNFETDDWPT